MKKKINHIAILIDRSGSTRGIGNNIIQEFNQQAKEINERSRAEGQETHLSLYTFSTVSDHPLLFEVPLGLVELLPITNKTYEIDGQTALFDTVGRVIEDFSQFHRDLTSDDHSFLIITLTDGQENYSQKYKSEGSRWGSHQLSCPLLKRLIQDKVGSDIWSFVFLVPPGAADIISKALDVPLGNIQEWDQTERGVRDYGVKTRAAVSNYFTARSKGARSTKSFFTADLTQRGASSAVQSMDEVTAMFLPLTVKGSFDGVAIKDFVQTACGTYTIGNAYYELTKPEDVQAQKKIIVQNIHSGKVYGGPSARRMLGLPDGGLIKLAPGNHGSFRIFVQSTSVNRKLVGDTTLMYLK